MNVPTDLTRNLTWAHVDHAAAALVNRWGPRGISAVYGVPMGGLPVAAIVAKALHAEHILALPDLPMRNVLVVDDLVDTGTTLQRYADDGYHTDALFRKPWSPADLAIDAIEADAWLRFPWESTEGPEANVTRLLQFIGEDPTREGLLDTPRRVLKAWREMTSGTNEDPAAALGTTFDADGFDEMVIVRDLPFSSLCEHHVLPFTGTATLAYIPQPGGRIVGLSKLPRLVSVYARRLQVQERMTRQIADTMNEVLRPVGVGVIIRGHHTCMSNRGIRSTGEMVTSVLLGLLKEDPRARAEFMALAKG